MKKHILKPEEIAILKKNRYVKTVSASTVVFTDDFLKLYTTYHNEMSIFDFFETYFPNYELLGADRITNCYYRWRKNIEERGSCERRKKLFSGTPITSTKDKDKIIERQALIIEKLKQENDFLCQIRRLERRYQPQKSPSKKNLK